MIPLRIYKWGVFSRYEPFGPAHTPEKKSVEQQGNRYGLVSGLVDHSGLTYWRDFVPLKASPQKFLSIPSGAAECHDSKETRYVALPRRVNSRWA